MKFLFDLFPVILFFIAFKYGDIFVATGVAIAATFVHDETFIKWKPTVLYWAFALTLIVSALVFRKNLIRTLLTEQMKLPDAVWDQVNWSWAGFFIFMGFANLAVAFAFNFSTDDWVNFKLFGGVGLMLVFVIAQGLVLSKYIEEEK